MFHRWLSFPAIRLGPLEAWVDLAFYKIQRFLRRGLRLRSACVLKVESLRVEEPEGFQLPGEDELAQRLQASLAALRSDGIMGEPLRLKA